MREAHRRAHRWLWPTLALVIGFAFAMALLLRPPIPLQPPLAGETPQ